MSEEIKEMIEKTEEDLPLEDACCVQEQAESVVSEESKIENEKENLIKKILVKLKMVGTKTWILIGCGTIATVIIISITCFLLFVKSFGVMRAEYLINAIGTVSLESEDRLNEAAEAYGALSHKEKNQVTNKDSLTEARISFERIRDTVDSIDAIGVVSLDKDSMKRVKKAVAAYDECTKDEQAQITNVDVLKSAEEKLSKLKIENTIKLINAIGKVSLNSKAKIDAAEEAYDELSASEKQKVDNVKILNQATSTYADLEKADKENRKKSAIAKVNIENDKVRDTVFYLPKNMPKYINTRSYFLPYVSLTSGTPFLKIIANYTGDDWVFWKNLYVLVDGQRYTITMNYFEVERDNNYGDVWETAHISVGTQTNFNVEGCTSISLLRSIIDSKETIVRFSGDSKHYDMTVSASDKMAMAEILEVYEVLN